MSAVSTAVQPQPRVNWAREFVAEFIANVIMTILMMAIGMNIMKSIGTMMVGSNASLGLQYAVGGTIHMMIGLIYGFLFAWLFGRVWEWNPLVKGIVYGLAIAGIAFVAMPLMASMASTKSGAGNPCGGGMASSSSAAQAAMNPCHSTEKKAGAMNPCHPQQHAANPCNPCNPGGGGSSPKSNAMSLINHLIYALTLAFIYKAK